MIGMQEVIRSTADRLFAGFATEAARRGVENGEWPTELWNGLEETGLLDALIGEGGPYDQVAEAAVVLRSAGAHAAPVPFAETMVARWLADQVSLPRVEGPAVVLPANAYARFSVQQIDARCRIDGEDRRAPWLPFARTALVVATTENNIVIAQVTLGQTEIAARNSLAGEPLGALRLANIEVEHCASPPQVSAKAVESVFQLLALARSVMIVGAAERVLELTVTYAGERRQFGRPISKFQAVQQNLALLAAETAAVGAVVDAAIADLTRSGSWSPVCDAACQRAREVADPVARIAHQVHGAIGFTHEYALHNLTRRLWAWRDDYGSSTYWAERIGSAALSAGRRGLWPMVTETLETVA